MSEYEKRILDLKVEEELERMNRRLHELADHAGVEHISLNTSRFRSTTDGEQHRFGTIFIIADCGSGASRQRNKDGDFLGILQEARDKEKTE